MRSLRAQIVGLVGVMLVAAMAVYLLLATRVVTADKEASVYDVNALVAGTVAQQVGRTVDGIADKLRYFGQEYEITPGDAERRARSLFDADEAVLSLEVFKRTEGGYERSFLFVDNKRLAALNLTADDLTEARRRTPAPLDAVQAAGVVLQNASLPPDLALVRLSSTTADGSAVVIADLRPEWLLSAVSAGSVYRVFLVDRLGRVLAHPDGESVIKRADLSSLPVVKNALGGKLSRGAEEYDSNGVRQVAAFARIENGVGAVVVEVPHDEVFKATNELSRRSLLFAVGTVSLALVLAVLLGRRVTRPLRELQQTMMVISRGEFGVEVPVAGPTEIQSVGTALNQMSRELVRRSEELQKTNAQLVQSEKLSAVGELAASVAHEVKNPMVGIVGFAQLGAETTDVAEMHEYFKLIENDAFRANKILQNLLEFSRPPEMELEALALNDVVYGSMALCVHQLLMQGVKVETKLGEGLPGIRGNSNQLRQVLLNLMLNAGQAMEQSPKKLITVTTQRADPGFVEIRVADTGPGLADDVKDKLFKPFFTTKRRGQGTGLGLSVSRSIIEAHRGQIRAEGAPGVGATFIIRLPEA
ncbi:MAG: sensor histidine kinase [Myxococcota bacterium]